MRLICDCGNEMKFDPIDPETNESYDLQTEYGNGDEQFVSKDYSKFDFWAENDEVGITCQLCKKRYLVFLLAIIKHEVIKMGVVTTYDEHRNDLRDELNECLSKAKKLMDENIWGYHGMREDYDIEVYLAIKKARDMV